MSVATEFVLRPLHPGTGADAPRVYMVEDFASASEVRDLRQHAWSCLERKMDEAQEQRWLRFDLTPQPVVSDSIGSDNCPEPSEATELLARIDERIGRLVGVPPHAGEEPMLVSLQQPGVTTEPFENLHHDKINGNKSRRSATVLIYLSSCDDSEGGHTIFPALPPAEGAPVDPPALAAVESSLRAAYERGTRALGCQACAQQAAGPSPSAAEAAELEHAHAHARDECERARRGRSHALAVRPLAGAALVFWSTLSDGTPDPRMWHAGCLGVGGQRWLLQKFKQPLPGDAWEDAGGGQTTQTAFMTATVDAAGGVVAHDT